MLNTLKDTWGLIAGVVIVAAVFLSIQYLNVQKTNRYLENLNISFSGVIRKDTHTSDHLNLCLVDLAAANPISYDVRAEEDFYFCVIKENQAEFIGHSFKYQLEVGDSISVIPNPMRLINYTKKTIHAIKLPTFMHLFGYDEVREKHEL